ncbi:DNA damage-inducible transcript 4 protein [Hoplias malabaricus]|uniref:DNA damage-inducible transcript 4 protein n=1 Tax=Hoplias malabaricus TaxID=27720 RepID=UPI0034633B56
MHKDRSSGMWAEQSAAEASNKRLSWSSLVQKLSHSLDSDAESNSSRDDVSDTGSLSLSDLSDADMFYDPMEESLCKEVVQLIACSLVEAKDCTLHCSKLLIPEKLLEHIGEELVHLAASEPCGLRGALIDLCVEQGDKCQNAGQIAADPYVVPTFQLTLILRLESEGFWPKIQGLFATKSMSASAVRHALKLSTGFRVIKKKLYSSEELLIEEC